MSRERNLTAREAVETYCANQVEGATPGKLLLQTYDYVIASCRAGDRFRTKRGIVELMGALDLEYLDVAGPLYRIYEYLLDIVREEKYDEAQRILMELREAWAQVIHRIEAGVGADG